MTSSHISEGSFLDGQKTNFTEENRFRSSLSLQSLIQNLQSKRDVLDFLKINTILLDYFSKKIIFA